MSLTSAANKVCFYQACKEIQEHLQVCTALVSLLEDVSSVEKTAGLQLIKIGSNSNGSSTGNGSSGYSAATSISSAMHDTFGMSPAPPAQAPNDALLSSLVTSWEAVIHASAMTRGKLGVSLASTLMQSVCKVLPDQTKVLGKRLQASLAKVQPLTEKVSKAKLDAQRLLEVRLVACT